ncbi:uncharacterized protein UV8b_06623 [Ustilaginoidea virens]|uniref:Carboxylic ester hydrolase n=1 Tax=Ustilaginoidea virens TaxID=1159556 RepID=A0A1B5L4R1_USTVR|nr:uncharacterized protein UV8b_06623 [Ustilaginoidea virens]QUC22382.1 hypothetical protein UV8b_06623 [Ustilaginoidea virens]GAO18513.1 hypothetical protein UVI_02054550 [Ustilaginoidea virens]
MKAGIVLMLAPAPALAAAAPVVIDSLRGITYHGLSRNAVDVFLNIPYGQDTSLGQRFRPPRPHVPPRGSAVHATAYGPACPQPLGPWEPPISLTNVTRVSEDCLNLNVARPAGTREGARLPVLVYLHGGSFWSGSNQEATVQPDAMILESVRNGLPVIHVAPNYRLGVFGFAQSEALRAEGSENAGLRDQRLALEWVRDNIGVFGGDAGRVTIFGQSSGGLSVGMHILAYGGSRPAPFHQAIAQSQALEPAMTGNLTLEAMRLLVHRAGCNKTHLHAPGTVRCLRRLGTAQLLAAAVATYRSDVAHNIGDVWLPAVDGDFLPAAPSRLLRQRRFANVTAMMGWCQDDVAFFTDPGIASAPATRSFLAAYAPGLSAPNLDALLALYPVSDFAPGRRAANPSAEFYRAARIFRDILMTCAPLGYAEQLAAAGNAVYLYDWNQTVLDPYLSRVLHRPGLGAIHTSELAYVFGNFSPYDTGTGSCHHLNPGPSDHRLRRRGSRSWSTFASTGRPGIEGHDTFQGFAPAFTPGNQVDIFVVGPHEGLSATDGPRAHPAMLEQKLRQRCAFINSPEVIDQLKY